MFLYESSESALQDIQKYSLAVEYKLHVYFTTKAWLQTSGRLVLPC